MTNIAIIGAAGRMGRRLIALAAEHQCRVVAAIARAGSDVIGRDAGELAGVEPIGVAITSELHASPQVLLDFSVPGAARGVLELARGRGIALLVGTTGLSADDHAAIDEAARTLPILQSPNMSLGAAVLFELARRAAQMLGQCDMAIVESHHRGKRDAPSGTALALAGTIGGAEGRAIPIHSLRLGDEVGRHTAHFALPGEQLELTHQATSRDTFARGALRAATWLAGQKPGRYAIADVLSVGKS